MERDGWYPSCYLVRFSRVELIRVHVADFSRIVPPTMQDLRQRRVVEHILHLKSMRIGMRRLLALLLLLLRLLPVALTFALALLLPLPVAIQDMMLERIDSTGRPGETREVDLSATTGGGS